MDNVVGIGRHGGGFPDADIADNSGCANQVSPNGGLGGLAVLTRTMVRRAHKVERRDSKDETLERSKFRATTKIVKVARCETRRAYFQTDAEFRGGC